MFDERNKLSHLVGLAVAIFALILAAVGIVLSLADKNLAKNIEGDPRSIAEIVILLILLLMLVTSTLAICICTLNHVLCYAAGCVRGRTSLLQETPEEQGLLWGARAQSSAREREP
jgi:hypothetical protein